jgi:hypothetical protein
VRGRLLGHVLDPACLTWRSAGVHDPNAQPAFSAWRSAGVHDPNAQPAFSARRSARVLGRALNGIRPTRVPLNVWKAFSVRDHAKSIDDTPARTLLLA